MDLTYTQNEQIIDLKCLSKSSPPSVLFGKKLWNQFILICWFWFNDQNAELWRTVRTGEFTFDVGIPAETVEGSLSGNIVQLFSSKSVGLSTFRSFWIGKYMRLSIFYRDFRIEKLKIYRTRNFEKQEFSQPWVSSRKLIELRKQTSNYPGCTFCIYSPEKCWYFAYIQREKKNSVHCVWQTNKIWFGNLYSFLQI